MKRRVFVTTAATGVSLSAAPVNSGKPKTGGIPMREFGKTGVKVHAKALKAYPKWDSVLMPIHAADHAYLSFEKTPLPIAVDLGIAIQAIKVFCKAFLLRSLSPTECLRYTLSHPVHVAICEAGTQGQMEDNIRTVQSFKPFTAGEMAALQKRAVVGQGVYTGPTIEYWKRKNANA